MHWAHKKFGKARNLDGLRNAPKRKQSGPKTEAMGATTTRSATEVKPHGAQNLSECLKC